jgi:hypothetical protein
MTNQRVACVERRFDSDAETHIILHFDSASRTKLLLNYSLNNMCISVAKS